MTESSEGETEAALLFEKANGVATFTLNRPAARNALTAGMFLDIERLVEIAIAGNLLTLLALLALRIRPTLLIRHRHLENFREFGAKAARYQQRL